MRPKTALKHMLLSIAVVSTLSACQLTSESFSEQLAKSERPAKDKARDAGRKPAQVMEFFDIEPGMTVLETLSSGGYYTEVLSQRVGNNGKVIAQNNRFILDVRDGQFAKEFDQRLESNRLTNVEHWVKEFGEFDLNNQVDAITVVLNYHDMYSNFSKEKRMNVLSQFKRALKPEGIVGVIDMESNNGNQAKLHRISKALVVKDFKDAGFVLADEATFLNNPKDDYSKLVFDPSVRGKTDRFVLKFKKG